MDNGVTLLVLGVGDDIFIDRGGLSGVVGTELVIEIMAVDISDAPGPGVSNRVPFDKSWRADTATDDSSADAVADDIACMEMMNCSPIPIQVTPRFSFHNNSVVELTYVVYVNYNTNECDIWIILLHDYTISDPV